MADEDYVVAQTIGVRNTPKGMVMNGDLKINCPVNKNPNFLVNSQTLLVVIGINTYEIRLDIERFKHLLKISRMKKTYLRKLQMTIPPEVMLGEDHRADGQKYYYLSDTSIKEWVRRINEFLE